MFGVEGDEQIPADSSQAADVRVTPVADAGGVVGALELDSPQSAGDDVVSSSQLGHPLSDDSDSENSSESGESEYEWEGWMDDLRRRRPVAGDPAWAVSPSHDTDNSDLLMDRIQGSGIGLYNPKTKTGTAEIPKVMPTRTLSSYASADSLFRRTIHRQMSLQHPPDPGSAPPSHAIEFMRLQRAARPSSPLALPSLDIGLDSGRLTRPDHGRELLTQRSLEPGMLRLPPRQVVLSMTPIDQPVVSLDEDAPAPRSNKGKERAHEAGTATEAVREGRRRKSAKKSAAPEEGQTKKRRKRKESKAVSPRAAEASAASPRPGIEVPRTKLSLSPTLATPVDTPLASESSRSSGSIRFATPYLSD